MENLSIRDQPVQGGPGHGPGPGPGGPNMPPPAVPQLPPQMFTTAAQLLDLTDSEYLQRSHRELNCIAYQ